MVKTRQYTIEREIYWDDPEDEDNGFLVELEITFNVWGEYLPAKVSGPPENCYPAEYPEVEMAEICCEHGAVPYEWVFGGEGWNPPWKDQLDMEVLEREVLEQDEDDDGPDPDDYYDSRCDRYDDDRGDWW